VQTCHSHGRSEVALSISVPPHVDFNGPYDAFEYNQKVYSPVSPLSPVPLTIFDPFPPNTFTDSKSFHEKTASAFQPVKSRTDERLLTLPEGSELTSVESIPEILDDEDGEENEIHVVDLSE
jgi:hypothetical protein